MTLDEQIAFMEELLDDDDHWSCENAKSEYRQLLKWLKDYKRLLEMPKGDLISREALKEDFKSRFAACNKWIEKAKDKETKIRASAVKTFIGEVIMTINNAPAVEAYTTEQVKELVDLNKKLSEERKQGKWKLIKDKGNNIHAECPFCKFQIKCIAYNYSIWEVKQFIKNGDYDFEFPNFCENCGAEMKGDVE